MLDKMFSPAGHKTFGAKFIEIGFTVFMMWFAMLVVVSFLNAVGLASIDIANNMPILGFWPNQMLLSHHFTVSQMLSSPYAVMGVLITIAGAPLLEEVLFRGICPALADENGRLRPKLLLIVLAVSFIGFGLVHGHGYISVMIQGVGGLLLTMLWYRNGPSMRSSYFSGVAAHSLYNISCVLVVWML